MLRFLLVLLPLSAIAQNVHVISFTWGSRPSPGYSVCTTGPYCLTGFTLLETTTPTPVVLGTFPESSTGTTLPYLPSVGTHVYELAQNSLDGSGNPQQTTGNPGIVVNCWKTSGTTRVCKFGKVWK